MVMGEMQIAAFIVTLGAVGFAAAVGYWAVHTTRSARSEQSGLHKRAERMETAVERANDLLAAHPGVLIVWEDEPSGGPGGWGSPSLYGAPAAIASLLRFVDATEGDAALEARILDGLADLDAEDAGVESTTLRKALAQLVETGAPFSVTIRAPGDKALEADGRPAGARIALWIADPNLKRAEQMVGQGRTDEAGRRVFEDPAAFEDMWSRLPLPAWRQSSGMKLLWANTAFLDVVEAKDLEDAQSRGLMLYDGVRHQLRLVLETSAPQEDRSLITAAGAQRLVETVMFPISGGVGGVAFDLTALAQAGEDASNAAARRGDALNKVRDAVAIFDPDKSLAFHNSAFQTMFGFDSAWLRQPPSHGDILDWLYEHELAPELGDYPTWRQAQLGLYVADTEANDDSYWDLPDERRLRVASARHPSGGVVLMFRDETELQRLSTELKTLITVQSATLDKLTDGLAVFGSDGKCQLQNAAFQKLWGLPPALTQPDTPFDAIAKAGGRVVTDSEVWRRMKARITNLDERVRKADEEELVTADGRVFSFSSRPLPNGATALSFADVTANRRLQEALRRENEAYEAAEKIRHDFVGHVSYQLRAPLQTVNGYAEFLDEMGEQISDADRRQHMGSIRAAGAHLSKLVEDILDIAAIRANTIDLDLQDVDLRNALLSALQLVHLRAEDRGVQLLFSCPDAIGDVHADAQRLKQVVYNLLLNAVDHTPGGGEVVLGAQREAASITVWVRDTGHGIPASEQAKVFEAFRSGGDGAGLGLTLVREFMTLHGGWVDIQSAEGEGTLVTCHFPDQPEGQTALSPNDADEGDSGDAAAA